MAKAAVTRRGAVLLGDSVACDAFDEAKPLRVVTHAHADHMIGLKQSLKKCERVLMTEATKDLIDVMMGPLFLMGGSVEKLDYGRTLRHGDERITLFKSDHMLGASQVLVEDADGTRIVYTGDFRIDATLVLDADVLVMEATYGSPKCRRPFDKDIKETLVSLVEEGLKSGSVHVFGYHGKLQEVMQILYEAKVKVPFVAPERVFHVSKICEKHGMRIGSLILAEEQEAEEIMSKNVPCVAFYHMSSRSHVANNRFKIYVSGWEFSSAYREISDKEYIVALSDHSDFDGLMEYVRRSKPKLVVTDNFRVGHAEILAEMIKKRFGIDAVAMPKN